MQQPSQSSPKKQRVLREFLFGELEDDSKQITRDREEKLRAAAFHESHEHGSGHELERWDGLS